MKQSPDVAYLKLYRYSKKYCIQLGINGVCIRTLSGHDNWIRALVFHPGGKYLLSCSDDKTIRCWDLAQEGKCVRVVEAADHFVSCLRWAPSIWKDANDAGGGGGGGGGSGANGVLVNGTSKDDGASKEQIRCLIACGSVDLNVRVYSA